MRLIRVLILQLIFLSIILLFRLPGLEEPLDNDSGANAYHARLILRGEPLYSSHHPGHHLPGIYYLYAAAFKLLGDNQEAIKIAAIVFLWGTCNLLYLFGKKLGGPQTGLLATLFYILLSQHDWLKGTTVLAELFANLPITAAILLGTSIIQKQTGNWWCGVVGILCGVSVLFKVHYVAPLVTVGSLFFYQTWLGRVNPRVWRQLAWRVSWLGIGFLFPIIITGFYFYRLGLGPRFLQVFTFGLGYVEKPGLGLSPFLIPILPIFTLAFINLALLIFGLGSVYRIIHQIRTAPKAESALLGARLALLLWMAMSVFEAGASTLAYTHYTVIMGPPLALLAAIELLHLSKAVTNRMDTRFHLPVYSIVCALLLLVILSSLPTQKNLYVNYIRYKLGEESYDEFLHLGSLNGDSLVKVIQLKEFIQDNTTPEDFLYYWSDNVQLYYLADRRAPVDNVWPLYAGVTQPYQNIFVPQTKYIILGKSQQVTQPTWLRVELENAYTFETSIAGEDIYRRNSPSGTK